MGLFGPSKAQRQQQSTQAATRKRQREDLEYTTKQTRGFIAKSERQLAEARAQGDERREAACQQVLNTWKDGLSRDLTRLNRLK